MDIYNAIEELEKLGLEIMVEWKICDLIRVNTKSY